MNSLVDLDENNKILGEFIHKSQDKIIYITLAADAASFKTVIGGKIYELFLNIKIINQMHF